VSRAVPRIAVRRIMLVRIKDNSICVPTDTSEKKEYNTTKNAMEKDDLKQKKKGGRSSAPGSTWVSL
jgi:hypothetical protein